MCSRCNMFKFLVFCSFLVVGALAFPNRIVNGTDADLGEIPYIVSIQSNGRHFCGGSILDATHVLTAAHCIYDSMHDRMNIQYGIIDIRRNVNRIDVVRKVYHAEYRHGGLYPNDIAVLTLAEPIRFSENARPTVLPDQYERIPANARSLLAGWGYPYSGGSVMRFLQIVNLRVYSNEECQERHHGRTDPMLHVCSGVTQGGKGQCSGDSGGPLYAGGKQIGVVSWSVKPCAIAGYPGVFSKVSSYINWIRRQMYN